MTTGPVPATETADRAEAVDTLDTLDAVNTADAVAPRTPWDSVDVVLRELRT